MVKTTKKSKMSDSALKLPPHSRDSEMMVIGSMLTNINAINSVADKLNEEDFYFLEHKIIFQVLKLAYKQDRPIDVRLTAEELKRQNKLEVIGGINYLTTLAQFAGTSAYIEEYSEIVKSKAILRKMIKTAQFIEKKAIEEPSDFREVLNEAQNLFFQISQSSHSGEGVLLSHMLEGISTTSQKPFLTEIQEKQEAFRSSPGQNNHINLLALPTYFIDVDRLLNGFMPSNLMILAARPAMGKTALALNIAENICFKHDVPVGIFSLEMSAEQLLHRIVCSQSEVESQKIQLGNLTGHDFQKIVSAVEEMKKHKMFIDDQPGIKISDLKARARRMKESHGIKFLIIDYLQLLSGSGSFRSQESRQNEISEISRDLKTLARELNIPILCLSQLSRKVEDRANHRPMMSDLRESGCLTGDSIITSLEGKKLTMKELTENPCLLPLPILSFNTNSFLLEKDVITKAFYSGEKQVFKLNTESGFCIKASENHPFYRDNIWTKLSNLKSGDSILVKDPLSSNIYYDKIISIVPLGQSKVFDVTVANNHNFIAQNIIVHNSIEQDSDLVMFLLRREYYDPHDKPGLAELIVAKNRHGAIGTVMLTFEKELALFRNYTPILVDT